MTDVWTIKDHLDDYENNPVDHWYEITARDGSTGIDLSECITITHNPLRNHWLAVYVDEDGEESSTIISASAAMTEPFALHYAVAIIKVHGYLPDNY